MAKSKDKSNRSHSRTSSKSHHSKKKTKQTKKVSQKNLIVYKKQQITLSSSIDSKETFLKKVLKELEKQNNKTLSKQQQSQRIQQSILYIKQHPSDCLQILSKLYFQNKQLFHQTNQGEIRVLFVFIDAVVDNFESYPLMEIEKWPIILQSIQRDVNSELIALSESQLQLYLSITQRILNKQCKSQIIQYFRFHVMSIVLIIFKQPQRNSSYLCYGNKMASTIFEIIISQVKQFKVLPKPFQFSFLKFYNEYYNIYFQNNDINECAKIQFFDIAMLSMKSKSQDMCYEIMMLPILLLKELSKENQLEQGQTIEENVKKIKKVLFCSQILNIKGNIASYEYEQKDKLFLVIALYHSFFMRLIDQLEKLNQIQIQNEFILGMFQIAQFVNKINRSEILKPIISKIFYQNKQMSQFLWKHFDYRNMELIQEPKPTFESEEQAENIVDKVSKRFQRFFYDIVYKIEKSLTNFPLEIYVDRYIENPQTFRSEYFILDLISYQNQQQIVQMMVKLTERWVHLEIKLFDFSYYLILFFQKCFSKDRISIMGKYIKDLEVNSLLKINLIIYKLAIEGDNKKKILPSSLNSDLQFNQIVSCGFADKYLPIDRIMPLCAQQIMWRSIIQKLMGQNKYFMIKCFYEAFFYEFTQGHNQADLEIKLNKMIDLFDLAIKNESIEESSSCLHLLVILYNSQSLSEIKLSFVKRLFQIILEKHQLILGFYQATDKRRSEAMSYLKVSTQVIQQNLKFMENSKKMHTIFLRNILKFIQRIPHIQQHLPKNYPCEEAIQIINKYGKVTDSCFYHSLRKLSMFGSKNIFENLARTKILNRKFEEIQISVHNLYIIREILFGYLGKFKDEKNQKWLEESHIQKLISYCLFIIQKNVQTSQQRQILKCKMVALEIFIECKQFCKVASNSKKKQKKNFIELFKSYYQINLRQIYKSMIAHNTGQISKYEKQIILSIRIVVIQEMLKQHKSQFKIVQQEEFFLIIYYLSMDVSIQIRLLIFNSLVSRFKSKQYPFQNQKIEVLSILSFMAIFEPDKLLKKFQTLIIESYREGFGQITSFQLTIFLYSCKLVLSYIKCNAHRNNFTINMQFFLKEFEKMWLQKKQADIYTYAFIQYYLSKNRIQFILIQSNFQFFFTTFHQQKDSKDYKLEREIKESFSNRRYSFGKTASQQAILNQYSILYQYSLKMMLILKRIKQEKARNYKKIKLKKCIIMEWQKLEQFCLLKFEKNSIKFQPSISFEQA